MADLTSSGLTTRTQTEILAEIEADQIAALGDGWDLSTSSPVGQINRLFSRSLALLEEALAAVYLALDPDSADGDGLLRLATLSGTIREPATASRCTVVVDLDADTYAIGDLAIAPTGRPEDRFTNAEEVTTAGGDTSVVFVAEETGPIEVGADTFEIASALAGFNGITSHPAATAGSEIETFAALRARRNEEVESPGSSSPSGIVADLTREIPEIVSCFCVENDTDATVDSIPAHSIEVVVFGPASPTADDDDAVAEQILASKAAGIGTYGTTTRTVYDDEDLPHAVRFTRPAEVPITVAITVQVSATAYAGDDAVADAVADGGTADSVPGLNAAWSMVVAWAMAVQGVLRVSAVSVNGVPTTDVAITTRQIATWDAADVTVTSVEATP